MGLQGVVIGRAGGTNAARFYEVIMPTEPNPADDAIQTGWQAILTQPGPVIVPPNVPILTLNPLDLAKLTGFREWVATLIQSSVIAPIGGLDPNQSQGPPAGTES